MMAWRESRRTISSSCSGRLSVSSGEGNGGGERTGCFNESMVMFHSHKRIRKLAEELLEKSSHAVHVVEEVFWVAEINFGGI